MSNIIPYYKPLGFTPLQAIEKLQLERPELADVPITYAGRLDPMAEGLLLLLCGGAVHRKQEFIDLPKTYEAKIMLGFSSDTFDILGLAKMPFSPISLIYEDQVQEAIHKLIGTHQFPYPAYSSKTINGKPLWLLTRWGNSQKLPTREMTVLSAGKIFLHSKPWKLIYQDICLSIKLVSGDFRQKEILEQWDKINNTLPTDFEAQIISVEFCVTSGTYIRTLANALGSSLNSRALLLHLKRTSIGDFKIS
jgi:tRNA pseudouridine55 synthase